jgi:hypothetical protein
MMGLQELSVLTLGLRPDPQTHLDGHYAFNL